MSSLADDLLNTQAPKPGRPCGACRWYRGLPDEQRREINEYLSDPEANVAHMHRVCSEKYGLPGGVNALLYHVRTHHSVIAW
jgi:hypothetical protein